MHMRRPELVVVGLLLVACGSGKGDTNVPTPAPTSDSPKPSTPVAEPSAPADAAEREPWDNFACTLCRRAAPVAELPADVRAAFPNLAAAGTGQYEYVALTAGGTQRWAVLAPWPDDDSIAQLHISGEAQPRDPPECGADDLPRTTKLSAGDITGDGSDDLIWELVGRWHGASEASNCVIAFEWRGGAVYKVLEEEVASYERSDGLTVDGVRVVRPGVLESEEGRRWTYDPKQQRFVEAAR